MSVIKRWTGSAWEIIGAGTATNMLTTDTSQTVSGVKTFTATPVLPASTVTIANLTATGTPSATTYLRGDNTWSAFGAATTYAPSGLTGATSASRYVGGTVTGAPTTGTFAVGDYVIAQNGQMWQCITAGTPGTWIGRAGTVYTGIGTPPAGTGVAGDFFLETGIKRLYGPKGSDTAWGAPQVPILRGNTKVSDSNNSGGFSITAPSNAQVGDLLLFLQTSWFNAPSGPPAGWAQLGTTLTNANLCMAVFYKIAVLADLTAVISLTGSYATANIHCYGFVDTTTPITASASVSVAASVQLLASSVAIAGSTPTVVVWFGARNGNSGAANFPSTPDTLIALDTANQSYETSYRANTGAVATSGTGDFGTSANAGLAYTIALNPQIAIGFNDFSSAANVQTNVDQTITSKKTHTKEIVALDLAITGLTGATAASRYAGATASGAPTTGTFAVGDCVVARNGKIWICTVAGTPGTWGDAAATAANVVTSTAATAAKLTDLATPPASPAVGDLWVDNVTVAPLFNPNLDRRWNPSTPINTLDDEFNTNTISNYTAVTPVGTATWVVGGDVLSCAFANQNASTVVCQLKPATGFAIGGMIETAVRLVNLAAAGCFAMAGPILTDGVTSTSNAAWVDMYIGAQSSTPFLCILGGTPANMNAGAGGVAIAALSSVLHLRILWVSANTFRLMVSSDGVTWGQFGSDLIKTMTPTYFGVAVSSWGGTGFTTASFEYLRVR